MSCGVEFSEREVLVTYISLHKEVAEAEPVLVMI